MSKIKQLSQEEAQKIAAGEVVERPANVVKELIENSLDAGATQITIYLSEGGKKLIRIIDNGTGMSRDDAILSIKQYATSKINKVDDLEWISTFGFRGEALASISSVSKMNITTKEEESVSGISLEIQEAKIVKQSEVASNTGTDLTIEDLFYNVIVRKKFLKSKDTELRAIIQLFYAFSLQNINVCFKLYHDDKLLYNFPQTNKIESRIAQIFESNLANNLITLDNNYEKNTDHMSLKISGAISKPDYFRYDKNQIFIFVNKRWVKNYKLANSLIKGYQGMLQTDRYPAGFIFINIDQKYVDINIHPRKEEVQFLHPVIVEKFIEQSVKEALEKSFNKNLGQKDIIIEKPTTNIKNNFNDFKNKNINFEPLFLNQEKIKENKQEDDKNFLNIIEQAFNINSSNINTNNISSEKTSTPDKQENRQEAKREYIPEDKPENNLEYNLIGQVKFTYIIIETQEGILFIDQHAAHERIMYEKLKENFKNVPRIKLLFPQIINFNQSDIKTIIPYLLFFEDFGLIIEQLNLNQLVIKETPIFLRSQPIEDILAQTISLIDESQTLDIQKIQENLQEKLHAQLSCKSAIKAGEKLSPETMNQLVKDLYKIENKLTCPHGRPTIWNLSQYELEKKFKRNYK